MALNFEVVLVDLPEQAAAFSKALAQVGMGARATSASELALQMAQQPPHAIVCASDSAVLIAEALGVAQLPFELPFFVLTEDPEAATKNKTLPRLVTAALPVDVDPGVLGLRLKKSLQRTKGRKDRQPTLMGFGESTDAVRQLMTASASASAPPSVSGRQSPVSAAPSAPTGQLAASAPPSVPGGQSPVSAAPSAPTGQLAASAPTSVAPAMGSVPASSAASQPSVAPASAPVDSSSVHTSAPPLLASSPSAPHLEADSMASAKSRPPVSLDTDLEALTHAQAAGKAKMIRVGAALVGAVVVLGGALAIFGGSSEELSPEGSETIQKSAAAAEQVAKKPPAPSPAPPPVAEEPKKAPEPSPEEKLAAMFRVENPAEAESCETILGKTPEQFASEPGWRAAHNWKLARKNLVAGNNEVAVELMCKAAFIDPRGSAVSGLVRFHLGNRALTRALALAERGVEVSNGKNRVARELMGDVYNQMGELEKARNIWLETMNLSVDDTDRLKAVVRNLAKQATKARRGGDYPLAERLLRRAASFEQDDAEVAASLAFVLQKNDQPALAKIWADHALELDSASKEAKSVLEQL